MNKILINFVIITMCLFAFGCEKTNDEVGLPVFELEASNASNVLIDLTISSDVSQQTIGILSIGSSAVYGFSPFRAGGRIAVTWSEGGNEKKYKKIINTDQLVEGLKGIYTLKFVYIGGQLWEVQILDKDGRELKRMSQ